MKYYTKDSVIFAFESDGSQDNLITEEFVPLSNSELQLLLTPPVIAPLSVSPRQIRMALTQMNLRTQVETLVSQGSQDLKDWWEFSTEFVRTHPQVLSMAAAVGATEEQIKSIWTLAASL